MQCYNCNSNHLVYQKERDSYVCLNCRYNFPKQYFFISHSHLDIEKVRIIRNIIEETFFYEPILFFLKCLSDDEEIKDLLQREIDERIWFVYCKSKNAENSKYVQEERRYIDQLVKSGKRKKVLEIELDGFEIWDKECRANIRKQLAYQIKKTKIFLSYAHQDQTIANILYDRLVLQGYSVWRDLDLRPDMDWRESIDSHMREHSYKDGIVLSLLTENFLHSSACMEELEIARKRRAMVLPIFVGHRAMIEYFDDFPRRKNKPFILLDTANMEASLEEILERIKFI